MDLPKAIQYTTIVDTTLLGLYYYKCRFKGLSDQKCHAILDACELLCRNCKVARLICICLLIYVIAALAMLKKFTFLFKC